MGCLFRGDPVRNSCRCSVCGTFEACLPKRMTAHQHLLCRETLLQGADRGVMRLHQTGMVERIRVRKAVRIKRSSDFRIRFRLSMSDLWHVRTPPKIANTTHIQSIRSKSDKKKRSTKILIDINHINRNYRISYSNYFLGLRFLIPLILQKLQST